MGSAGKIGRGVYFWVIDESEAGNSLGRKLSQAWYNKAKKDRYFEKQEHQDLATVFADLKSTNTLDLTNQKVSADFFDFFEATKAKFPSLKEAEKSSIYDRFVDRLEHFSGSRIDMVTGATRFPTTGISNDPHHIAYTMNFCVCAAVRNLEIIEVENVEYSS